MTLQLVLAIATAAGVAGLVLGWFLRILVTLGRRGSVELEIKEMMLAAREAAERIEDEARREAEALERSSKAEAKAEDERLSRESERLAGREQYLDRRQQDLDLKQDEVEGREAEAVAAAAAAEKLSAERRVALERASGLSAEAAKAELVTIVERDHAADLLVRLRKLERQGRETLDAKAREILAGAVQRLATPIAADAFTSTVTLPSDEAKGKIIGREGRNIKAFERATGVEIIVDDTPGQITLSSFDPMRREIAAIALRELIDDGRIQPVRIEAAVEKAKVEVGHMAKRKGEEAAFEVGAFELDPRVLAILGRLHFRTSYGQNVLNHSVEMSHLAGMLAEELGANVQVAKTAALLHDIGKAVDHEVPGTHVEIGRRILQKFGVSEDVVKAMQAHHGEYPYETVESIIVQVADSVSGGRPGARRDSVEGYIQRLGDLEAIAAAFPGVEKVYALQAGRELRVFVKPEEITDMAAYDLAKKIARKIEAELKYPGEIKVAIIRESRVVEYAR